MTDDRQDDDEQLKSLRQVWLSMRDEVPPASGLEALMAAARSHAEVLVQPTLWQRIVATLRRPPMLALATVMLLIGGVVIFTRHDNQLERAPTAPSVLESTDKPAPVDLKVDVEPKVPLATPVEATRGNQEVATPRAVPQHHAVMKPNTVPRTETGFATGPAMQAAGGASVENRADDKAADGQAEKADVKKDESPNAVLVEQLATQAHTAIKRGDCETARSIGARIARQDATYYRDHVATELANCSPH